MRSPVAAVILIISLCMVSPAIAGPYEDAATAVRRGDYKTAYRLYKPLAEQGFPIAQLNLGYMYANGQGVPQDYAEAMKWYRKAANQGDTMAQYNLGVMYASGQGVPQNYAEASKWYRKAADHGDAPAQFNLGSMYAKGQGVRQDYVLAYAWFHLAASRFPVTERESAQRNRDHVASKMTPAQIAEAQKLSREWKPKKEQ
jgi:uncharacterized protein